MKVRDFLYHNFKAENEQYFGNDDEKWLSDVCDAWMNDESNSKHRYDTMRSFIGDEKLKKSRILDMSSGCGTFVFYGLMNGYNVYGIEPSGWKHRFNLLKTSEKNYPDNWIKRFAFGVGENLPFNDESFDIISTYQTLEHVQSHQKCFDEFKRVLKPGGALFIQCPDYNSFYEGHYRIQMLPLMNKSLLKRCLKIINKPTKGLDTINYITKQMIFDYLNNYYKIYNVSLLKMKSKIYNKIKICSKILSYAYLTYCQFKKIFRRENSINLIAVKHD
jgi:ubiquinone/menaquinone biosynthesis C-methylase UbiE